MLHSEAPGVEEVHPEVLQVSANNSPRLLEVCDSAGAPGCRFLFLFCGTRGLCSSNQQRVFGGGGLPVQTTCVLWTWIKLTLVSPGESSVDYWLWVIRPSVPRVARVRAVFSVRWIGRSVYH